jgi:hypothetical protein
VYAEGTPDAALHGWGPPSAGERSADARDTLGARSGCPTEAGEAATRSFKPNTVWTWAAATGGRKTGRTLANTWRPPGSRYQRSRVPKAWSTRDTGAESPKLSRSAANGPGDRPRARNAEVTSATAAGDAPNRAANERTVRK